MTKVLILLFLEYGLRPQAKKAEAANRAAVLILLFLEYGLRLKNQLAESAREMGLNPTFSGIWSATCE